ncbi:MAG: helix-turn-helix transcriptional regulator [Streptococcaceae bacterium]|jgi:DNA-binding HxlR family transcriptional regulator|nr:helix-turn-helix transcriptional regulator [Streptococcaceae bacterium]
MKARNEKIIKKSICPARKVITVLKGKYTLEILSEIIDGNLHYGSLMRSIKGINPRILAQRLHEFECIGVLSRKVLPTNPPQVEYRMTEKGMALRKIVEEMKNWDKKFGEE